MLPSAVVTIKMRERVDDDADGCSQSTNYVCKDPTPVKIFLAHDSAIPLYIRNISTNNTWRTNNDAALRQLSISQNDDDERETRTKNTTHTILCCDCQPCPNEMLYRSRKVGVFRRKISSLRRLFTPSLIVLSGVVTQDFRAVIIASMGGCM